MDCRDLRERLYEGDEAALKEHASACADCAAWLKREERLLSLLGELRKEASEKTIPLAASLRRPDVQRRMIALPRLVFALAAAAVVVIAAATLFNHENGPQKPELSVTRVLVIEGRVRDDAAPPQYIEVDGKQYPVERVSATEGTWKVAVTLDHGEKNVLLTAVDASGNRSAMNVRIRH